MHDTANLEAEGCPTVFVASTEFIEAAHAQSEALAFEPAAVYVQHPIQDRTDEELQALADSALDEIVRRLTGS